jgi:hypothetical protein
MDITGRSLQPGLLGRTDLFELPRVGHTTLGASGCMEEGWAFLSASTWQRFFTHRYCGAVPAIQENSESSHERCSSHLLTSSLRFRFFETVPGAFPLDKDPEQIWFQHLESNETAAWHSLK